MASNLVTQAGESSIFRAHALFKWVSRLHFDLLNQSRHIYLLTRVWIEFGMNSMTNFVRRHITIRVLACSVGYIRRFLRLIDKKITFVILIDLNLLHFDLVSVIKYFLGKIVNVQWKCIILNRLRVATPFFKRRMFTNFKYITFFYEKPIMKKKLWKRTSKSIRAEVYQVKVCQVWFGPRY